VTPARKNGRDVTKSDISLQR